MLPLFGNATMHVIACLNWLRARLFHLDRFAARNTPATLYNGNGWEPGRPNPQLWNLVYYRHPSIYLRHVGISRSELLGSSSKNGRMATG